MLPVVVGDDGKIVADIARYSNQGHVSFITSPHLISEDLRKKKNANVFFF